MTLYQQIHIDTYLINDLGIYIAYVLNGKPCKYVVAIEDAPQVLLSIGNSIDEPLSQYDAIMLAAAHENEKMNNRVHHIKETTDLAGYANNFFMSMGRL